MTDLRGTERRLRNRGKDRRQNPRGGRRRHERRAAWRHLTWLFVGYGLYLAARAPGAIRRAWRRRSS